MFMTLLSVVNVDLFFPSKIPDEMIDETLQWLTCTLYSYNN